MTELHSEAERFLAQVLLGSDLRGFDYTISGFRIHFGRDWSPQTTNVPLQVTVDFASDVLVDGVVENATDELADGGSRQYAGVGTVQLRPCDQCARRRLRPFARIQ